MIDYVMPITKESLEALRDLGFRLSRGCRSFISGGNEGFQILFLDDPNTKSIFNMESAEGKPTKTLTLQDAQDIMLLIDLGLTLAEIRESIKEIM